MCCSPWGHKESDTTEGQHNSNNISEIEQLFSSFWAIFILFWGITCFCPSLIILMLFASLSLCFFFFLSYFIFNTDFVLEQL